MKTKFDLFDEALEAFLMQNPIGMLLSFLLMCGGFFSLACLLKIFCFC